MNRFSGGPEPYNIKSTYIPLPLDLISRKLQQKQEQHDTTKAQLGAMEDAVLGVRGLSVDEQALKAKQAEYNDEILKGIEEVGGDYSRLGGLVDITSRKLKKDLTTGHLAAIQSNLATGSKIQQDAEKWKSTEGGERGYALMMKPLQEFKGTTVNADGTYSKISEYTPVKAITLPKVAQDYAKSSHDQYLASGEQYLNEKKVSRDVYNNLIKDSDVISNIREEILYRHGKLSGKEETDMIQSYLQVLADNAGAEVAYLKPTSNTEKLAGMELYDKTQPNFQPYDFTGDNPTKPNFMGRYKQATKDIHTKMQTDFNKKAFDEEYKVEYMKRYREDMSPSEKQKLQGEVRNNINNKYKETLLRETFTTDPILRDRLQTDGKDINKLSKDEMEQYLTKLDKESSAPVITSAHVDVSPTAIKKFNTVFETSALANGRVTRRNGEVVPEEELNRLKLRYGKTGFAHIFGGAVKGKGKSQPYPDGSQLFESNAGKGDGEGDDGLEKYVILPYTVNSPSYLKDRALYALNSRDGYTEYVDGTLGTITLQRVIDPHTPKNPDGTDKYAVKKYINGDEYTEEAGSKVMTVYTIEDLLSTPKTEY